MDKTFAIVLPLKKAVRLDPSDLISDLRLMVEQTGATVRLDPRALHGQPTSRKGILSFGKRPPEVFAFDIDGVRIRVSSHSEPFVARNEMGRYVNPATWNRGLGEFTDHRAYIKIYEAGIEGDEGLDSIYDRAAAVTVTASVIARIMEPTGAIWTAARNSLPMSGFFAAVKRLEEGAAPLDFWLRWQIIPPGDTEDAHSGLITCGLGAFLGYEIAARPSGTETREMIDHALEIARRLIDEHMEARDEDVVDGVNDEPLRLRIGPGRRKGGTPVCEISLVNGPKVVQLPERPPPQSLAAELGQSSMPPPQATKSAEEIVRDVLEGRAVLPPPGVPLVPPPPPPEAPSQVSGERRGPLELGAPLDRPAEHPAARPRGAHMAGPRWSEDGAYPSDDPIRQPPPNPPEGYIHPLDDPIRQPPPTPPEGYVHPLDDPIRQPPPHKPAHEPAQSADVPAPKPEERSELPKSDPDTHPSPSGREDSPKAAQPEQRKLIVAASGGRRRVLRVVPSPKKAS